MWTRRRASATRMERKAQTWWSGMSKMALAAAIAVILLAVVGGTVGTASAEAAAASDSSANEPALSETDAAALNKLLPLVGGALVDIGRDDHETAAQAVADAKRHWESITAGRSSDLAAAVDEAITAAERAVAESATDAAAAKQALADLAGAVNAFKKAMTAEDTIPGPKAAQSLLPMLNDLQTHIQSEQWSAANADYRMLESGWRKIEQSIRDDNTSVYGSIETSISMIRIALNAEPPRADEAKAESQSLAAYLGDYSAGKLDAADSAADGDLTVADLIAVLDKAAGFTDSGNAAEAEAELQSFIRMWPTVEGQVSIRSSSVYRDIENKMTEAPGYLLASPPQLDKASALIAEMKRELQPFVAETRYTAWDAGAILLREGLEAILVLAALLAYLKKSGNNDKRRWVWSGVWSGLAVSGVMAFALTYWISKAASGSTREMIEGFAGLGSVLLMLTVGSWLHGKSNMQAWNRYIDQTMGSALRRGSLWSLFAVSCLAIAREGAETTIFYIGMAPSIAPGQLMLGFGITLLLLVALAYVIIKFSVKLPIRLFFLSASALIYYLVFRFLGESIHSLQVAGKLPAHTVDSVQPVDWLGIYPTWETVVPQLVLLAYVVGQIVIVRTRAARMAGAVAR